MSVNVGLATWAMEPAPLTMPRTRTAFPAPTPHAWLPCVLGPDDVEHHLHARADALDEVDLGDEIAGLREVEGESGPGPGRVGRIPERCAASEDADGRHQGEAEGGDEDDREPAGPPDAYRHGDTVAQDRVAVTR